MMKTVSFCDGRYNVEVLPVPGNATQSGYIQFINTHWRRVDLNAKCIEYCIQDLPKGLSVIEHFGGAGLLGVMIDKLLEPSSHLLFDIDPDCIQQLQYLFGANRAKQGNAKELIGTIYADLIVLDFNWFTAFQEEEWAANLKALFELKPKYVTIADVANQKMGIHRNYLSRRLQTPIKTNEDYITAMSHKWHKQYGYSVKKCAYHIFSFMLLTPDEPTSIQFRDIRK